MIEPQYIKVYFAAPYTNPDPEQNVKLYFEAVALYCQLHDLTNHGQVIVPVLPHGYHELHKHAPASYDHWMALDRELIKGCDVLVRFPGQSSGAEQEVGFARGLKGMTVIDLHNAPGHPFGYDMEELIKRMKRIQEVYLGR